MLEQAGGEELDRDEHRQEGHNDQLAALGRSRGCKVGGVDKFRTAEEETLLLVGCNEIIGQQGYKRVEALAGTNMSNHAASQRVDSGKVENDREFKLGNIIKYYLPLF